MTELLSRFRSWDPRSFDSVAMGLALWTLGLVLCAATSSAQADVVVDLGASGEIVVPVGSDLEIVWPDGPKQTNVNVSLINSTGITVATRTVSVGSFSWTEPIILWPVTGVFGCDDLAATAEARYRFATFVEALEALSEESLELVVEGDETTRSVSIVAPVEPIYYFSDESACPRALFARSEVRYLSGWVAGERFIPRNLTLFLQRSHCAANLETIFESRGEPQAVDVAPRSQSFTERIGTGCQLGCGRFIGIVRSTLDLGCTAATEGACSSLACEPEEEHDTYVYAIDPENLTMRANYSGKSRGYTSRDWDDGKCDSCAE